MKYQRDDGQGCDCGPFKLSGECSAISTTKEALLQPLVSVGGSSGSRDVIYPIQEMDCCEKDPWSQESERTDREE